jgi:hypothetical protein
MKKDKDNKKKNKEKKKKRKYKPWNNHSVSVPMAKK